MHSFLTYHIWTRLGMVWPWSSIVERVEGYVYCVYDKFKKLGNTSMASFHTCWLLGWSGCSSSTKELHGMAIWMHIWNYLGGGYFPLCDLSSIFVLILILVAVIGLSMLVDPHPGLRHAVLSTVHSTVFDYIHCFKAHSHNVHFTLSGAADVCTAAKKIEKVLIFCTQLCATAACGFTANLR